MSTNKTGSMGRDVFRRMDSIYLYLKYGKKPTYRLFDDRKFGDDATPSSSEKQQFHSLASALEDMDVETPDKTFKTARDDLSVGVSDVKVDDDDDFKDDDGLDFDTKHDIDTLFAEMPSATG
jgi:hypothetical protein